MVTVAVLVMMMVVVMVTVMMVMMTTMLGYNPRKDPRDGSGRPGGFLYTWDGGNQLTYPVKYHDIGYRC